MLALSYLSLAIACMLLLTYRTTTSWGSRCAQAFSIVVIGMFNLGYYIADTFTGEGITSGVVYYLFFGLAGAGWGEYLSLILFSAVFVVVLLGIALAIIFQPRWIPAFASSSLRTRKMRYLGFAALVVACISSPVTLSAVQSVMLSDTSTSTELLNFDDFYRYPHITPLPDDAPMNLVLLYAEGLEYTYFDEHLFPGLLSSLRDIADSSIVFTAVGQHQLSHHTIAGMVATQCGFPLVTPLHAYTISRLDSYLPSARCLGDLLKEQGYHLAYYGGASLDFGGKGRFYASHGFDERHGRDELLPLLPDASYVTSWGLYDDTLFPFIFDRFVELSEEYLHSGQHFVLTGLTLDTHHPFGNPSQACEGMYYGNGMNPMLNAVVCSDYLIGEFVEKIRNSPYSNQTVIVILSDHLAMPNTAIDILRQGNRSNLFMIQMPEQEHRIVDTKGWMIDIGTTILPFIGFTGDIGLGRNLVTPDKTEMQLIRDNLDAPRHWRQNILQFWDFPRITEGIVVYPRDRIMSIDQQHYPLPIYISLDTNLETILNFELHDSNEASLQLHAYALQQEQQQPFVYVDFCQYTAHIDDALDDDERAAFAREALCLMSGKGQTGYVHIQLTEAMYSFSVSEIRTMVGIS